MWYNADQHLARKGEAMYCAKCGTEVPEGNRFCANCGAAVSAVPEKRSGKPIVGGILGIVAGVLALGAGIALVVDGANVGPLESVDWEGIGFGISFLVTGTLAVLGSSFAIPRRNFVLAVIGAVLALWPMWPLGIPAIVLISLSYEEFRPLR